ncbi:ParB domain protein nuclease [Thermodesulfatator indicus DSM 15286]|uniref:ParB domain protein nuclease n=1 Tax=Thermodesulfatator indicus (strain DSM 15286 / JCM 11887 / CIR29812) TaxID=667014 RepID=F8ACH8_THEID|nr:ParB N-terminal domain-containing protein [Thermodesulfatator indicus]AEH44680.1 ParB domain protein nuclease [Thermodesulfatator indicus DSM 15286]
MRELCRYKDPVKNQELCLSLFQVDEILIPSFQRDLSEGLKRNLELAIEKLGFLHPIVVVEGDEGYYVVDGRHRLEALKELGYQEIIGIIAPQELALHILEFNTEKPPNVKEKSKQAYRLFYEFLEKEPQTLEIDLISFFKEPSLITFGFILEEFEPRFPASFYESFVSKIDNFLHEPLEEASKERRRRAEKLVELNQQVNETYARLGLTNALLKGEIVRKAVQRAYGIRVRKIDDEFYEAIEKVKEALNKISPEDIGGHEI